MYVGMYQGFVCYFVWCPSISVPSLMNHYLSFSLQLAPTGADPIVAAMKKVQNPRTTCDQLYDLIKSLLRELRAMADREHCKKLLCASGISCHVVGSNLVAYWDGQKYSHNLSWGHVC